MGSTALTASRGTRWARSSRAPLRTPRTCTVHNPDDPFIDPSDVRYAAESAARGLEVRETHVAVDHVKTLFAVPKTIFSLSPRARGQRAALAPAAGKLAEVE